MSRTRRIGHTCLVTSDVATTFAVAGRSFVELVDLLPGDGWDGPGLGEWNLKSLVGHTSRSLITVINYLQQPAAAEEVPSAAVYYQLSSRLIAAGPAAVTERGRQAGVALGENPVATIRRLYDEAITAVSAVADDPVITTIVGGMRLSRYLPTRTFELTVHSLDIAAATGLDITPPAAALHEALHLAADVALLRGDGARLLLGLTGRTSLPAGYSIV